MTGPLADAALSALILSFVLPAALLVGGGWLALWRGRRRGRPPVGTILSFSHPPGRP